VGIGIRVDDERSEKVGISIVPLTLMEIRNENNKNNHELHTVTHILMMATVEESTKHT
jgi:hypothetical protein